MRVPRRLRAPIDSAKLGWASGEIGPATYTGLASIYLLFYATNVLRIPPAWAGFALLVPRIWNILGDPFVGYLSDRTRTRYGRRRPYLLGGSLLWAMAFVALFNLPVLADPRAQALLFGTLFLVNNTGLTLYQVPYSAMLAEMTDDPAERTRLVAYKEIAARAAILLTLLCAPLILAHAATAATGFSHVGVAFGALIAVSGLIAFGATAGAPSLPGGAPHGRPTFQIAPLIENRPFRYVTLGFLLVNMGDAVFSGSLVYYVTQALHRNAALIAALYPVSSATGILCTPLWAATANRLGKARACRFAIGMNALVCVVPWFLPTDVPWLMYPFMCLYGLFNTGARLIPSAMVPDTVEVDQQRTGQRREGVIFGLFVFAQQTGFAAGGLVLSGLLALAGMGHAGTATAHFDAVSAAFTFATAALYGLAFAAILGYPLERHGKPTSAPAIQADAR